MSPQPNLALSIRQPWAWMILHGGKDIENRTWQTKVRGRVLIHAAKGMTLREYEDAMNWVVRNDRIPLNFGPPNFGSLRRGGIVGSVEIVDCVRESSSAWHDPTCWGFILRNPKALPFGPCPGKLGFFQLPQKDSR